MKVKNKDWLIHYGDSGEPNSSLSEVMGIDEVDALRNFAKEFDITIPTDIKDAEGIKRELLHYCIMIGDIEAD